MKNSIEEFGRYFYILSTKRWLFLLVTILVTVTVLLIGVAVPKRYRADSTVFIKENIIKDLVKGIAVTSDIDSEVRVLRFALITRNAISKALQKVDPALLPGGGREISPKFIEEIQQKSEIRVRGKDLFTVSITDQNPKFAQEYINALVGTYVEENVFNQRESTYGAERFLGEQLKLFKQKLDDAENAIIEFRKKQGTYVLMNDTAVLDELKSHSSDLERNTLELGNLEAKRKSLLEQLSTLEKTLPVVTAPQDPPVRLAAMEQHLSVLLAKYTDSYPEVVQTRALIEQEKRLMSAKGEAKKEGGDLIVYNPIYVDVKQKLMETEAEISSRTAAKQRIQEMIAAKEANLRNIPESQKQLGVLEQERNSAKRLYQELLGRTGQAEVSKQMEIGDKTVNFRIVDPAILSSKPVWPNMYVMVLLSALLGIASGIGAAISAGNFKPVIYSLSDLKKYGVEVLSVVPVVGAHKNKSAERRGRLLFMTVATCYLAAMTGLFIFAYLWQTNRFSFY